MNEIVQEQTHDFTTAEKLGWFFYLLCPLLLALPCFPYPFIQAISFSLSDLKVTADGYELNFTRLANYRRIFLEDPTCPT